MNICGLITEYNPFHQGHRINIEKAKALTKADYIICLMSGNFVQRGEPAIMDKFSRAEAAVKSGVDLVIELPSVYATANAGNFALGAIGILNSLNIVNSLCFGSKLKDTELLCKIADLLINEDSEFKNRLKKNLKTGMNYPSARAAVILDFLPDIPNDILKDANTLLGIEYITALKKLNSDISPVTYVREKGYQACDIRQTLLELEKFRNSSLNEKHLMRFDDFSLMLQYRLLYEDFKDIYGMTKTLYNKIKKSLDSFDKIESFIDILKTKDITKTHIKRAFIHTLINISSKDMSLFTKNTPNYIRILACSQKGKEVIKLIDKASKVKIITNPKQKNLLESFESLRCFDIDMFASELYNAARAVKYSYRENEYKIKIF